MKKLWKYIFNKYNKLNVLQGDLYEKIMEIYF